MGMTTTIKIAANGTMTLPAVLRKTKRLKAGTRLRVTEAGENILLTPVHPPTEEELEGGNRKRGRAWISGNLKKPQAGGIRD